MEEKPFDKWFKQIDPKYYKKIVISGPEENARELTYKEFRAGIPGYVLMDQITGKLIFKDKK